MVSEVAKPRHFSNEKTTGMHKENGLCKAARTFNHDERNKQELAVVQAEVWALLDHYGNFQKPTPTVNKTALFRSITGEEAIDTFNMFNFMNAEGRNGYDTVVERLKTTAPLNLMKCTIITSSGTEFMPKVSPLSTS